MNGAPADAAIPYFASAKKVYPQNVSGPYRRAKWWILIFCLGLYYGLPFLRWDRGPNLPDQAVLVDLAHNRFYFFFIEIWPQEVYYFTGLLILAAFTLFLMNAVAGRLWCGYLCPQTVWTDLFLAVERVFEGDRRERMRRDSAPFSGEKLVRKTGKHIVWLLIAWWTGGAWVLYFADAPTLVRDLATFAAPISAYAWIGILTFTTYTLAGIMREQVCTYMCPWPRIQAALTDHEALNVTYRYDRGEPRLPLKKAARREALGEAAGDCVDCHQCVAVCPTGIDIRDGAQLDCIQCGLCIDACDAVMAKIDRKPGLIGYDTEQGIRARLTGKKPVYRPIRPRTLLYFALIVLVGGAMLYELATRSSLELSILHERTPLFVTLRDGAIRNVYAIRLLNKRPDARLVAISVAGLPGLQLDIIGAEATADSRQIVRLEADSSREVRALLTAPAGTRLAASQPIVFTASDLFAGEIIRKEDHFIGH